MAPSYDTPSWSNLDIGLWKRALWKLNFVKELIYGCPNSRRSLEQLGAICPLDQDEL